MPGRGEPFAEPNPAPASDPRRHREGQVAGSPGPPQRQKVLGLEGRRVMTLDSPKKEEAERALGVLRRKERG